MRQRLLQQHWPLACHWRLPSLDRVSFIHQASIPAKYAAPPCDICRMIGALASLAASREATTVEEDVTFYRELVYRCWMGPYNGGDSELMFASIFEKLHVQQTETKSVR